MPYVEKLCTKCCHLLGIDENDIDDECACGGKLIPLELDHDDYITLCKAWSRGGKIDYTVHWDLYNAMVELKKKDIIEYNLKMSQFKTQLEQQESARAKIKTDNRLKCPTCGSAKVIRIPGLSKATWVALQGVYSIGKISKTFQCMNCGYKW